MRKSKKLIIIRNKKKYLHKKILENFTTPKEDLIKGYTGGMDPESQTRKSCDVGVRKIHA